MLCSSVPVLFFINLGCGGDDIPVLCEPHQIIQISQKKTRGLVLSFFFHSNNDANPSRDYSGIERSLVINFHIISSEDFFSEKKRKTSPNFYLRCTMFIPNQNRINLRELATSAGNQVADLDPYYFWKMDLDTPNLRSFRGSK